MQLLLVCEARRRSGGADIPCDLNGPIRRRHAIVLKLRPEEGQLPGADSVPFVSSRVNDQETSNVILDDPSPPALLASQNRGPTSSVKTMTEDDA